MSKPKRKLQVYWPGITLMLALAFLAVPATVMFNIMVEMQALAGNPVAGDRFANDLNPKISRNQLESLTDALDQLPNVESLEVNLRSATLRINVMTPLTISDNEVSALIEAIKTTVFEPLPKATYFTATTTTKQYDIEIHIRNTTDVIDSAYFYVIVSKTSLMDAFLLDVVSVPRNPEFVAQLQAALNP